MTKPPNVITGVSSSNSSAELMKTAMRKSHLRREIQEDLAVIPVRKIVVVFARLPIWHLKLILERSLKSFILNSLLG